MVYHDLRENSEKQQGALAEGERGQGGHDRAIWLLGPSPVAGVVVDVIIHHVVGVGL
jgi:hypothetical protein